MIYRLADTINQRVFEILKQFTPIYKLTSAYRTEKKAWRGMRTVSSRVIKNAEEKYKKSNIKLIDNIKSELRKPCLFIEQVYKLFNYSEQFDEQQLKDEIDTLIAGVILNTESNFKLFNII